MVLVVLPVLINQNIESGIFQTPDVILDRPSLRGIPLLRQHPDNFPCRQGMLIIRKIMQDPVESKKPLLRLCPAC